MPESDIANVLIPEVYNLGPRLSGDSLKGKKPPDYAQYRGRYGLYTPRVEATFTDEYGGTHYQLELNHEELQIPALISELLQLYFYTEGGKKRLPHLSQYIFLIESIRVVAQHGVYLKNCLKMCVEGALAVMKEEKMNIYALQDQYPFPSVLDETLWSTGGELAPSMMPFDAQSDDRGIDQATQRIGTSIVKVQSDDKGINQAAEQVKNRMYAPDLGSIALALRQIKSARYRSRRYTHVSSLVRNAPVRDAHMRRSLTATDISSGLRMREEADHAEIALSHKVTHEASKLFQSLFTESASMQYFEKDEKVLNAILRPLFKEYFLNLAGISTKLKMHLEQFCSNSPSRTFDYQIDLKRLLELPSFQWIKSLHSEAAVDGFLSYYANRNQEFDFLKICMVRDIGSVFFACNESDLVWQMQENKKSELFKIATFFTELQKIVVGTNETFNSAHEKAKRFIMESSTLSKVISPDSMTLLASSDVGNTIYLVLEQYAPPNEFTRLSRTLIRSLPLQTRIALAALASIATGMALPTVWRMLPDDARDQLKSAITQMTASTNGALSKWQDTLTTPHPTRAPLPTQTPTPTNTPTPTHTPTPTYTPSPTETPRPTSTQLSTETPQLNAVLNDAEFMSSKPSMYGIYHQIPTTQSLRLGDDVGFFPTQHILLSGEVSRNPFGHIQNLPIDFDKHKQALIYTTKITSRQILPPSGYRIEALYMQQPYTEILAINPVGTILIDSDKVPVPYGQDITVVAYPRTTVSEKRNTPYAYALDSQRQIELDTLNASLYQDSILQKIHASFVAELKNGPDRASQIAKKYTQLLQEYTYTYRYYSIDTGTNINIKPGTSLVWLAQNRDAPYYCAIAADAAAQFFSTAGFEVYVQTGHDTSIGLNKTLVTGILHANIILKLPDGEVITVDLTPIPASNVNSQARQYPGSRFVGQGNRGGSRDGQTDNLRNILGQTLLRPTPSVPRESRIPIDGRGNLIGTDYTYTTATPLAPPPTPLTDTLTMTPTATTIRQSMPTSTLSYKYEPEGRQDKPRTISEIIDYANLHDISLPIILTALLMSQKYLHARKKGAETSVDVSKIDSAQLAVAVVELVVSDHYDIKKVAEIAEKYANQADYTTYFDEIVKEGVKMLMKHEVFGVGGKAPRERAVANQIYSRNIRVFTEAKNQLAANPKATRFLDDCITMLDGLNRIL